MFSSVFRAPALLCESSYSLIRMRPYMLIALLCIRFVYIDSGNHGVRKRVLVTLMKICFLWNIVSVFVLTLLWLF